MDISVNENIEKIKLRDIFVTLKDIFVGNNINVDDNTLNKEIEKIRKVESEIGVSDSIRTLEKQLEKHYSIEKTKRKSSTKISSIQIEDKKKAKTMSSEENKTIEDEEIDK